MVFYTLSEFKTRFSPAFGFIRLLSVMIVFWGLQFPGTAAAVPPPNDNFANSVSIAGSTGATTGTNVEATTETGEPDHVGLTFGFGKSVWWSWVAPANEDISIDTLGSDYDTLLAVYTGTSVSGLTLVVDNDDAGISLQSKVIFTAQAGTTYHIAVDGIGGDFGFIALNWRSVFSNDVLVDFGSAGLWAFTNNSNWAQLHGLNPESIVTGEFNNGFDDVVVDFGAQGLWAFVDNNLWVQIHGLNPDGMAAGDITGTGPSELLVDFGSGGLWSLTNGINWLQLHGLNPDSVTAGDIDGGGIDDVLVDFGTIGSTLR